MLQLVTLHLARNSEFPEGSSERGYEIVAPIDESGHPARISPLPCARRPRLANDWAEAAPQVSSEKPRDTRLRRSSC